MALTASCATTADASSGASRNDPRLAGMSLFSRLFRGQQSASAQARPAPPAPRDIYDFDFGIGEGFVTIRALGFFGQFSRSPDGRYLLAWRDGNDEGTRGGFREEGPGRFYLFEEQHLVAHGRAERPNDSKVADNGSFIINDWQFGEGLKGSFHAYRRDGSLIVKRQFAANLYNNGIAPDGRLAVCQTCNAPGQDGSILTLFDLSAGIEIAAWVPPSGWANSYSFLEERVAIRLHYQGSDADFSHSGDFLDRDRWMGDQANSGNAYRLCHLLREWDGPIPSDLATLILDGLISAMAIPAFDERQRPTAHKVCGMCLEALGAPSDALKSYEAAITLDPKIGLKRKAAELRRMLA